MNPTKTHQKNISTTLIAVPASNAADRTSVQVQGSPFETQGMMERSNVQLYLAQKEKRRRLIKY